MAVHKSHDWSKPDWGPAPHPCRPRGYANDLQWGGDHTAKTKTFISSPIEHLPQSMGLYLNPDRLKIDGIFYEYQKKTRDNNLLLVVAVNIC